MYPIRGYIKFICKVTRKRRDAVSDLQKFDANMQPMQPIADIEVLAPKHGLFAYSKVNVGTARKVSSKLINEDFPFISKFLNGLQYAKLIFV